jgi:hypothetical protein
MKFATEKVRGEAIDIEVNGAGEFSATYEDQDYTANSKKELIEQLDRAVKKAKTVKAVDVTVLGLVEKTARSRWDTERFEQGDGFVQAKLRSRHERQRVWLMVTDDKDKTKFAIGNYRSEGTIVRRLTPAECAHYLELCAAVRVAEAALKAFIDEVQIEPAEMLKQASVAAAG